MGTRKERDGCTVCDVRNDKGTKEKSAVRTVGFFRPRGSTGSHRAGKIGVRGRRVQKIGGTLNPSYVQLPNFNTHVCSSNGKNSTSISHDDLNMAGGFHSTSPTWYMVALVASVTSKFPSALRITHKYTHSIAAWRVVAARVYTL